MLRRSPALLRGFRSLRQTNNMAQSNGASARSIQSGNLADDGHHFDDPVTRRFLDDVHKLIVDEALVNSTRTDAKVVNFTHPKDLQERLDLSIGDTPVNHGRLLELCRDVIHYSVKTGNVGFYNQLYAGLNAYGLAGAWLTDALNTNLHTFEVAPAFVVIEKYMLQKLCGIVGFENGDGVFCPGGSFSNIMAASLARYRAFPEGKETGLYGTQKLRLYSSVEAHYSLVKGAAFLGMGTSNVVAIETDAKGQMKPDDLEKRIKEDLAAGHRPMFVMATSGTTVLGAYDPLDPIAEICQRHGLWLHCDACWGGGALLSDKLRHLMSGVEKLDSLAWNFHKMTPAPLQCSALVVKQKGILEACNRGNAEYLFQQDKFYDTSYDIGDKTVQCGRKVDAMKLWLMWMAKGDAGMAASVERAFDNSRYLIKRMKETEGFRLVLPEFACTNVCFWYIPPSLRGLEETPEWWDRVAKVAPKLKELMTMEGSMLIGYNPLTCKNFVNFFRIIINNTLCEHKEMDFVIAEIDRLGRDLKF